MTRKRRDAAKKERRETAPETFVDRLVSMAEKDRFNIVTGFAWLMVVSLSRAWLEGKVLGYASLNLYYYAWQVSFFATVFMGAIMVLSLFSGAGFRKVANATLFIFPIILLPPLLDHFVFSASGLENAWRYSYLTGDTIMGFVLPLSGGLGSSWGLMVQGWCVILLVASYIWSKTKAAAKSAMGCLGVFGLMIFLAARPFILTTDYIFIGPGYEQYISLLGVFRFPVLNYYGWLPDAAYVGALIYQQKVLFYIAYNTILFAVFFWLSLLFSSKAKFRGLFGSVRGLRMAHFSMMVVLGVLMVRLLDPDFSAGLALDPFYILHIPYIMLAIFSTCFAWQFTTMLNDIYDMDIDRIAHPGRSLVRGLASKGEYRTVATMFGLLALCTSAVLGVVPFILIAAFLSLGITYSMPPVRFREHLLGTSIIGLGSLIAYLMGVYSPGHWDIVYWEVENFAVVYQETLLIHRIPPFNWDIFVIGLMILLALTLAPMMTQMRDYEGDMKAGAKSIFTALGYERGRKLVRTMVPMLFLLPLLVINEAHDFIILSALALASHIILTRHSSIVPVFAIYFIAALYSLLRILT